MTKLKRILLFFNRQISQIRKGGLSVLFLKLNKFLFSPFLRIFISLVFYFRLDWPPAYFWKIKRLNKKYKKVRSQPNPDLLLIKNIGNQIIYAYKKYISYKPSLKNLSDWMDANRELAVYLWNVGDVEESNKTAQTALGVQSNMMIAHQLDKLGIAFIPGFIAYGSIGNYVLFQAYIKAGMLGLAPQMKNILILDGAEVNNPCFLNYLRPYLTIISDPSAIAMLEPLKKCLTAPIGIRAKISNKLYFEHMALGIVEGQWHKEARPSLLSLSNEDRIRGKESLRSFGLPENAWFVCLHVREQGSKDNGSSSENFRNSDIETYYPAIKAVITAGGWVIRLGDRGMTPLPQMPNVIDYAHSAFKSDWMDVFLCASCRFLIGTSSGPISFSMAFGVPVVFTNFMPPACVYCFTPKDLFLPRVCRHKKDGSFLSFKELFSPPVSTTFSQFVYDDLGVKVLGNGPEELKALVEEMIGRLNGTYEYNAEDERLQEKFRLLTSVCGSLHGVNEAKVYARIGRDFLRKYGFLLPE